MRDDAPRSCASCAVSACAMHQRHGRDDRDMQHRTAWLLDDVWPEYASYVASLAGPDDQLIAPGLFGNATPRRYAWGAKARHVASLTTAARHLAMWRTRRAPGHVRQRAYMAHDQRLALRLASDVDYRARHLVVAQSWLPWLAAAGVLGGRSYDVLMSRYPLADIHRLLDRAARELGQAADGTITDFRAPETVVRSEMQALANARRIITPHHGIAALFPKQALTLAWHLPPVRKRTPGSRTAFLGPSLPRQRPDLAQAAAHNLAEPLILFGQPGPIWTGWPVESRRMDADWLNDVGAIFHPATMTAQPRRLLEALAHGVTIYATPACGLAAGDFIQISN